MATRRLFSHQLYPFASRWFEREGLAQHYLDEGSGPPVVMVHGNPTWSFYFRELVAALRGTHRCIVPDHIGCGLSDKPGDDRYEYTLQSRVDDLDALLDHLKIENGVTLVVHDWGGMIGCAWALRRPERIARIVVLNTAAFLLPPGKKFPWRLRVLHSRNRWTALAVQGLNLFSWPATWMATAKGLSREIKRGLMAPYDSWNNRRAVLRFVQDIPLRPRHRGYELSKWVDDNLHRLADRPILICWGMKDFVFDEHFLAEWQRRFPDAKVHAFVDAGHYVLEDARDRVIRAVSEFLGVPDKSSSAA
jgi:haloalkane dehalogenase